MNARRRTKADGLPSRVYVRYGSYHWVRHTDEKWIKLCRVGEGQTRMLERLAEERRKVEVDCNEGSFARLVTVYMDEHIAQYAESFRKEWRRRGEDVRKAFPTHDIEEPDTGDIEEFLKSNWPEKLPTQRAMKGWLSKFFSWAVRRRYRTTNPCREVQVRKPKVRRVYISHADFLAIRRALAVYTYERTRRGKVEKVQAKVPTGEEMQVLVDLCYLTCQRSTDIRNLRWSQVDEPAGVIHFVPSKTEDSTGEPVDWPITPEIAAVLKRAKELRASRKVQKLGDDYVLTDMHGKQKTAAACRAAWREAMARAGLAEKDYTIKDIRAKAMTDASKAGYDLDALQVAGAHADRSTTQGYIKQREVPVSTVRLQLPAA